LYTNSPDGSKDGVTRHVNIAQITCFLLTMTQIKIRYKNPSSQHRRRQAN